MVLMVWVWGRMGNRELDGDGAIPGPYVGMQLGIYSPSPSPQTALPHLVFQQWCGV
jgi:hypothetical protein